MLTVEENIGVVVVVAKKREKRVERRKEKKRKWRKWGEVDENRVFRGGQHLV